MAFTSAQIAQIYEIIRIPQGGGVLRINAIADPFGPAGDSFSHAAIITKIDAILAAAAADTITRVGTHLTRWTAIGGSQPVQIAGQGNRTADYIAERAAIRRAICDILGIVVGDDPKNTQQSFTIVR